MHDKQKCRKTRKYQQLKKGVVVNSLCILIRNQSAQVSVQFVVHHLRKEYSESEESQNQCYLASGEKASSNES